MSQQKNTYKLWIISNYIFFFLNIFCSSINASQCRRNYSENSAAETPQPTTELEKKLLADVEELTNQNKTLEEKNNDLLVMNSLIQIWYAVLMLMILFWNIFIPG